MAEQNPMLPTAKDESESLTDEQLAGISNLPPARFAELARKMTSEELTRMIRLKGQK